MDFSLLYIAVALAGGLVIFFMGFIILRENAASPVNRATALMLFSGALGSIMGALGRMLDVSATVGNASTYAYYLSSFSYLWEFFFPSLLYFALVFPVRHALVQRRHTLEVLIYVPHFFHLLLVLILYQTAPFTRYSELFLDSLGSTNFAALIGLIVELVGVLLMLLDKLHQQLFSIVNLTYAGVAIALLHLNRSKNVSSALRAQMAIVLLGLTLCVTLYVTALLLNVLYPYRDWSETQVVLISVSLGIASASIAYAIIRHKFLDMQNLARRSLLLGSTALVLALIYLVIIKQLSSVSAGLFGSNTEILEAGFLVIAIVMFQPVLNGLEEAVENFIRHRDKSDRQIMIGELSRQLAAEVDLRGMRDLVADRLCTSLSVSRARLITVETRSGAPYLDAGDRLERINEGGAFETLLKYFEEAPQPISRSDMERNLRIRDPLERGSLHRWAAEFQLLVPLVQNAEVRGILALGPKVTGGRFHTEDMALLSVLGQQVTTSIENVQLLSDNVQKRLLEKELALAAEIQQELLPKTFPQSRGYNSHGVSYASKAVGGDYFDLFSLDGVLVHLAIADVSGKGVPAALLMSSLRAGLRSTVKHLDSPAQILGHLNQLLYESTSPEKFATFFYGVLDPIANKLVYANAGHNYPILVRASRESEELDESGLILGAFPGIEYTDGTVDLEMGDTLFLYTDGVTEAVDGADDDFGEARLHASLRRLSQSAPRQVVQSVLDEVREFTNGADAADDLTMLVLRRLSRTEAAENGNPTVK